MSAAVEAQQAASETESPSPEGNNSWFWSEGQSVVLVFLHGVLSDSTSCWFHKDSKTYWPDLVRTDRRVSGVDIFMAGYYTAIDSGSYEVSDAADEVMRALKRRDSLLRKPVMHYDKIVFVAHSLGGVVARYILDTNREEFSGKHVGLMLFASPSYGSREADKLSLIIRYFRSAMGHQLKWGNWSLRDLDRRFRDLIERKLIPRLSGIEAVENHFVFHWKYLPIFKRRLVVTEESAGLYFGKFRRIPGSDHFTIVKPNGPNHDSHLLLVDFLTDNQFVDGKP